MAIQKIITTVGGDSIGQGFTKTNNAFDYIITAGTISGANLILKKFDGSTITIAGLSTGTTSTNNIGNITGATNLGGGTNIFFQVSGNNLQFYTLSAGTNTTLTQIGNVIKIDNSQSIDLSNYVTFNPMFNSYTATTNTNKLDKSTFVSYTASTLNTLNTKVDQSTLSIYTAGTQSSINNKLDISSFSIYSAGTVSVYSAGTNISLTRVGNTLRIDNTALITSGGTVDLTPYLQIAPFSVYSAATANNKLDKSVFASYTASTPSVLSNIYVSGATNLGNGFNIFESKSGNTFNFNTISAGSNTTITKIGNVFRIDSAASSGGTGTSLPSQSGNGGRYLTTDGSVLSWADVVGSGTGSTVTPFVNMNYSSTVNLNFASNGNNIDLSGVTGDFTITSTNLRSGAERVILIRKTTASPINIFIDPATLSPSSRQGLSTLVESVDGSPDKFIVNTPINSVLRLIIYIEGASGSLIPDIQLSMLGTDNAIPVTANFNTVFVDHATYPALATDTNEHILLTIPVDANKYKANSYLILRTDVNCPFSGNGTVQFKARMGTIGISSSTIDDFANLNAGTLERGCRMDVISSSLQKVKIGYAATNPQAASTRTIDLSVANNIYLSIQKGLTGDTVSISSIKLEIGNAS